MSQIIKHINHDFSSNSYIMSFNTETGTLSITKGHLGILADPLVYNCSHGMPTINTDNVEHLKFEHLNTSKCNTMSHFLSDFGYLKSIDFGKHFDTSNVLDMHDMFAMDNRLESLALPNTFDTSKVLDMHEMFLHDWSLKHINFGSKFNTLNVNDMSGMFNDVAVRHFKLPDSFSCGFYTRQLGTMFCSDQHLESVELPNSFRASHVRDMSMMFDLDPNLRSITLPKTFIPSNVGSLAMMFGNCESLSKLTLPNGFGKIHDLNHVEMEDMFTNDFIDPLSIPKGFPKQNQPRSYGDLYHNSNVKIHVRH